MDRARERENERRSEGTSPAGKEAPIINNSEAISYARNSRLSILIARFGRDLEVLFQKETLLDGRAVDK